MLHDTFAETSVRRPPTRIVEAKPIELGCGVHVPVRSSRFCSLYEYERSVHRLKYLGEKTFAMPTIVQTIAGPWEFRGKSGHTEVDHSTIVAGSQGAVYGCKHETAPKTAPPDVAYIARLKPGAIDEDELIFDKQVLERLRLPALNRAVAFEDDDEFESCVFEIFNYVSHASLHDRRSRNTNRLRVQRIKRFIEAHVSENIGLDEIAKCVDVTPFTCIRQFKSATSITPHQYLDRVRMHEAKSLLKKRNVAIPEVAARVGMRDYFYFTRWFAKHAGLPPGKFRDLA